MAKILITGNGYDLSYGLPTSYKDFIKILGYVNTTEDHTKINFKRLYSISSNSTLLFENFKEFEFNCNQILTLQKDINSNFWFNFFTEELDIETWIDFETKIEYLLILVSNGIKHIRENIFINGSLKTPRHYGIREILNNNLEVYDILIKIDLIRSLKDLKFFHLNPEFLKKRKFYYTDIDENKICKFLIKELENFKHILSSYFRIFVFPLQENYQGYLNNISLDEITHHYTFNYTMTFKILNSTKIITHFIHGGINSDSNNIVLGINEIPNEIINKKTYIPFAKYFQTLDKDTYSKFITDFKNKTENCYFFFYGHSLDESDKYYINEVFDFIKTNKAKKKKIIVIYHNNKSRGKLIQNLLNIRGNEDIHYFSNNNLLVFEQSNSTELEKLLKEDISNYDLGLPNVF